MKLRYKWLLAIILTTIVVATLARLLHPLPRHMLGSSPHRLLDKASRLSGIRIGYHNDGYLWLPDHDLLVFHRASGRRWIIVRRNIQTAVETPLPQLSSLFQHTGGNPWSGKVSPDGRYLIWAGIGKIIYGATMAGKNFQQWPYDEDETGISYWLPDSQHFLRYRGNQFFDPRPTVLRSIATPNLVKHLPLDRRLNDVQTSGKLASLLTPPSQIYAEASTSDTHYHDAYVTVSALGMDKIRQGTREVPLPPDFALEYDSDPRFLSDGQWLIWIVSVPAAPHGSILTVGVYISHADGTAWHFVGDWTEPPNLQYYQEQDGTYPYNFRWMPGDQQISFEYKSSLYTISAD